MTEPLTSHLAVPVADDEDARETARTLDPYEYDRVTAIHVIEKGEGVMDKLAPEQAEQRARDAIEAFREVIPEADEEIVYRRDVVAAILDVSADVEASAIAFRPRGGSRLVQFLSGDTALKLVTAADRPVIALPDRTRTEKRPAAGNADEPHGADDGGSIHE